MLVLYDFKLHVFLSNMNQSLKSRACHSFSTLSILMNSLTLQIDKFNPKVSLVGGLQSLEFNLKTLIMASLESDKDGNWQNLKIKL